MSGKITPEQLRSNALTTVEVMHDRLNVDLTFDQAGVDWVDGYINRLRDRVPADQKWSLGGMLACFVGECIIQTYGGVWTENDGWWGIQITQKLWACPFTKVDKQFQTDAEGESVASFFSSIPALLVHLESEAG